MELGCGSSENLIWASEGGTLHIFRGSRNGMHALDANQNGGWWRRVWDSVETNAWIIIQLSALQLIESNLSKHSMRISSVSPAQPCLRSGNRVERSSPPLRQFHTLPKNWLLLTRSEKRREQLIKSSLNAPCNTIHLYSLLYLTTNLLKARSSILDWEKDFKPPALVLKRRL